MKILLIAFIIIGILDARENPFFPSDGEKDIPYTTNETAVILPLKKATIALPPQARVLQGVTIQYKNLDGSEENKTIPLENSVDWHKPIFISQNYTSNDAIQEENIKKDSVKKETVKIEEQPARNGDKYQKIASFEYASFYSSEKYFKIITNDKIIRNFLLIQPHRIVIDFKSSKSVKFYEQNITENVFTKIRVGNHDGYYRVVIELDGYYRYNVKNMDDSYVFQLL
ncbi:MAG: AMIN domain-containing protein [Campylobacterales bacterium]|nr:AMIN domain-containing protein [Campylobacterales bacterium]